MCYNFVLCFEQKISYCWKFQINLDDKEHTKSIRNLFSTRKHRRTFIETSIESILHFNVLSLDNLKAEMRNFFNPLCNVFTVK